MPPLQSFRTAAAALAAILASALPLQGQGSSQGAALPGQGDGVPHSPPNQVITLDDGTFTILSGGQPVGREVFSIRSTPGVGGSVVQSVATITYDDRRLSPVLKTDAAGSPSAYQLDVRVGADVVETFRGDVRRGRFSATSQTPRGESRRDFVISEGAIILDDDVFHHYFFLTPGRREGAAGLAVVIPQRNVQLNMLLEPRGAAQVTIGETNISANLYRLAGPEGEARDIWVDGKGRVLRVDVPDRGISAVRDSAPRN